MPTRVPARRADRRVREFTQRINTAKTERSLMFALVGWLLAEYYKIQPDRRRHWIGQWVALAKAMNKEVRDDAQ